MITQYIQAAMRKAKYEILENNEGSMERFRGFKGFGGMHRHLTVVEKIWQKHLKHGFCSAFRVSRGMKVPAVGKYRLDVEFAPA